MTASSGSRSATSSEEDRGAAPTGDPVREEILAQAIQLFRHFGFAKTSMSDIAGRCSMSPANLYRYFRNKQAIGLAAVNRHFISAESAVREAMAAAPADPEARIRALSRAIVSHTVRSMDDNPRMIELAEFVVEDLEGWEMLERHILWRREQIMRELERGVAAGQFAPIADVERAAIAFQHAIKAFNMPFALARWKDRRTVLPELEGVLDLVFRGIRRPEALAPDHDRSSPRGDPADAD